MIKKNNEGVMKCDMGRSEILNYWTGIIGQKSLSKTKTLSNRKSISFMSINPITF